VRQRITVPLDMTSSTMATTSTLDSPYAHGYMLGLSDEPTDVTGISASAMFGNGNLVSTRAGYRSFLRRTRARRRGERGALGEHVQLSPHEPRRTCQLRRRCLAVRRLLPLRKLRWS
jgi:hypothetical protein